MFPFAALSWWASINSRTLDSSGSDSGGSRPAGGTASVGRRIGGSGAWPKVRNESARWEMDKISVVVRRLASGAGLPSVVPEPK